MVFCCIDDDRPRLSAKKLKTVIPEEDGEAQQHGEPQTKAGGGGGQPPVAVITALESPRVSTSAAELTPFSAAASVVAQPDPSSSQQQLQESSFGAVGRRNPMVLLAPLAASLTATPTENLYPSQKLPNILHHHHHQNQIQNQEPHNINQASDKLVDPDDGSQQQDHPNSSAAASSSRPTSSVCPTQEIMHINPSISILLNFINKIRNPSPK